MARKKNADQVDLESSLDELNQLVEKLEHGGLSLEDSLKIFERGMTLSRSCHQALKNIEQKIQILKEQDNKNFLEPYQSEDDK